VHTLECFIEAKQEFLSEVTSAATKNLSVLYDYQRKYITALLKQLPPGSVSPVATRSILMHPPTTIKFQPLRQGPFLLQPSPRDIEDSEGGDATDIAYISFESHLEGDGDDTEHLGVIAVAFQDGKIDIFLDVEKVEARWEHKQVCGSSLSLPSIFITFL
jgi:nucleoporin NUP82